MANSRENLKSLSFRCYIGCIPNSWSVRRNDMTSSRLNMPTTW